MFDRDSIINRLKDGLLSESNKMEGSFAADNIGAVAEEFEMMYAFMQYLDINHYVNSAEGEYLDRKAVDYGLSRKKATKATGVVKVTGTDGVNIPKGTILVSDTLSFETVQDVTISSGIATVKVVAVEPGTAGNIPPQAIKKLEDSISGVTKVENESAFTGGTEDETDDSFRERLLFKIQNPATSGNVNHYKIWASEVNGVGRVRVFPLHAGAGTVKVSILDDNADVASSELIEAVKKHIDPDNGQGTGKAPIGAKLTVTTAVKKNIAINARLRLVNQSRLQETKIAIEQAIKRYFKTISYNEKINYVSYAKIVDILFDNENIEDFEELRINNGNRNIVLGQEEIPFLQNLEVS
ncbi:MAG: baseplate J/gp47 family protein [Peptostreptococcaceae bacterium]|nr:baseplate J/gp47 family protein [Peptostreptococcaceae bacterium]